MKLLVRICAIILCSLIFISNVYVNAENETGNLNTDGKPLDKFNNALYQGQDPFVTYKDGYYYFVSSSNLDSNNKIYVSKSKSLLDQGEKIMVFDSEGTQTRIYAPEIFFIQGKWYIYYCADFMYKNKKHLAGVLESVTDDPQGEYVDKGPLYTGVKQREFQANDFTVFEYEGQLYGVWGTMPDEGYTTQPPAPAIAKMDSPTLITEDRTIMLPKGGEGPRAIVHEGKLFITVSHGGFANLNYHLAMYTFKGGDILDTKNWTFKDNVFNGTDDVYSSGRASFVKSADGTEDWMMYHSKVYKAEDNGWRNVYIQKFTWNEKGNPVFGKPISPFEFQNLPSGDEGIGLVYYAENASYTGGEKGNELQGHLGQNYIKMDSNQGSEISFSIEAEIKGDYFVRSRYSYSVLENGESEAGAPLHNILPVKGSMSVYVNDVFVCKAEFDKTGTDWDRYMYQGQRLKLKAGPNKITYKVDENDSGNIQFDYIAVQKIEDKTDQSDLPINIMLLIGIAVAILAIGLILFFIIKKRRSYTNA